MVLVWVEGALRAVVGCNSPKRRFRKRLALAGVKVGKAPAAAAAAAPPLLRCWSGVLMFAAPCPLGPNARSVVREGKQGTGGWGVWAGIGPDFAVPSLCFDAVCRSRIAEVLVSPRCHFALEKRRSRSGEPGRVCSRRA